jgi:hypothetical protein
MCEFPKNVRIVAILLCSVYLTKLEERDLHVWGKTEGTEGTTPDLRSRLVRPPTATRL